MKHVGGLSLVKMLKNRVQIYLVLIIG